jgi:hypothetical protein
MMIMDWLCVFVRSGYLSLSYKSLNRLPRFMGGERAIFRVRVRVYEFINLNLTRPARDKVHLRSNVNESRSISVGLRDISASLPCRRAREGNLERFYLALILPYSGMVSVSSS